MCLFPESIMTAMMKHRYSSQILRCRFLHSGWLPLQTNNAGYSVEFLLLVCGLAHRDYLRQSAPCGEPDILRL